MATDDATRWDERYAGHPLADPAPPDALAAAGLTDVTTGMTTALDVACGAGSQSTWAALRGLDVTAIDVSPEAVRLTERAADAHGVEGLVHATVVDLDAGLSAALGAEPSGELQRFDLIVCQRFRDPRLYADFVGALSVGGVGVVTVLSESGAENPGPFHAPAGELRASFARSDLAVLFHDEGDGNESIVVRRLK